MATRNLYVIMRVKNYQFKYNRRLWDFSASKQKIYENHQSGYFNKDIPGHLVIVSYTGVL